MPQMSEGLNFYFFWEGRQSYRYQHLSQKDKFALCVFCTNEQLLLNATSAVETCFVAFNSLR